MRIFLKNISKSYDEGGVKRSVLMDINAELPSKAFTIFLGKSGAGKSTLLNLIGGLDTPDQGEICIGETMLHELSDYQRTVFRRKKIGFVFQFFNLIPTLTVLENVAMIRDLDGRDQKKSRIAAQKILEQVGLGDRLKTMPDRLSGGEQQRVAIARALAHDPEIVLADEPTGNLDSVTGSHVLDLMMSLCKDEGKTLIMATHSREALAQADRVFCVKDKKLIVVSPPESGSLSDVDHV